MSEIANYRNRDILVDRARKMRIGVWVVTALVMLLVAAMRSPYKLPVPEGMDFSVLPKVHAGLNTLVAASLLAALMAILRGAVTWHKRFMTTALVVSGLFLLSYVAYHFTTVETKFGDADANGLVDDTEKEAVGMRRTLYLTILSTHIIAAALSFPFILHTFVLAWSNDFDRHRRLAKKVYPLWLFVAVTGPICYFMLKPYYY